jgi:hypothetical protein
LADSKDFASEIGITITDSRHLAMSSTTVLAAQISEDFVIPNPDIFEHYCTGSGTSLTGSPSVAQTIRSHRARTITSFLQIGHSTAQMSTSINIYSEPKSFASIFNRPHEPYDGNVFYSTPSMVNTCNLQPAKRLVCDVLIATYSHSADISRYDVNNCWYCQ